MKGKYKNSGKVKSKFQAHEKGKGNTKWKHSNIDDPDRLSAAVKVFHETISSPPIGDEDVWKHEVFKHYKILDNANQRKWCMDHCTQHVRDILGREKNKRLYIGPGRDGSSFDKISVDVKFHSRNTQPMMPENKYLRQQGCVKSSFGYELDEETQTDTWIVLEDQVDMRDEKVLKEAYAQLVVIIHPMFSTAENNAKAVQEKGLTAKATSASAEEKEAKAKDEPVADDAEQEVKPRDESITEIAAATHATDNSPTQEEEANYEVNEGDGSLPSDVRTTIKNEREIDQADL